MTLQKDRNYLKAAWALILCFAVFRFFYAGSFLLAPDETNYWQWSRHPALGYHDQAPMIGWAIAFFTSLFGHSETAVRLPSVIGMFVASAYMVLMAARWFGPKAAFNTALLSQGILEFNVGGLMATPDGLQAAAWAGAAYHIARAYEENGWDQWLIAGTWFGFGMLSKYTMVLFGVCAYLYGLSDRRHRGRLFQMKPYAGVIFGTALFSPVLVWNAQNKWQSLRHVAYIGGANEGFSLNLKYFGDFLASQAALLSPLVFILVIAAWIMAFQKGTSSRSWMYRYLFFTSFPMVAFFAVLSFHTRIYGNWPGAGYVTAAVLTAVIFGEKPKIYFANVKPGPGRRLWPWAVGSAYFFSAVVLTQVVWPILPIPPKIDRTATEITGWRQVGETAGQWLERMPCPEKTFLFGLRYQIASELAFYTPGRPQTVSINRWRRPNVYDYWWEDKDLLGWDAVGVTRNADDQRKLAEVFEHVAPPIAIDIYRDASYFRLTGQKRPVKTLYLFKAYGFKGGLRWIPPNAEDIRAVNK